MLKMRPFAPVRYHDAHCVHTEFSSRACSMSLYLSVAASVGTTLVSVPERSGVRSLRMCGIWDSSEKMTDVCPVVVLGPEPTGWGQCQ